MKKSFTNFKDCHSGSRLDEFCARLFDFKRGGTYVDIGSADSMLHNNSFYLANQLSWSGLCVELESRYNESYYRDDRFRRSYINGDATKLDYKEVFKTLGMPPSIDYLSLDVDVLDLEVIKLLPHDEYRFKVIGIEHDAYQYGDKYRVPQREFILSKGYELVCSNIFVRHPDIVDSPFEDWYLDPTYFSKDIIDKVRSESCYPGDVIVKLGGLDMGSPKKSYSQVGQDLWALENAGQNFTFLDVGCMEPYNSNNTFALELEGWKGLALDFEKLFILSWNNYRKCPAVCANALDVDWGALFKQYNLPLEIGYLSLDLYGEELEVLHNLTQAGISFRCATIEHDNHLDKRNAIREFLGGQGYTLAVPDVLSPPAVISGKPVKGQPFEDWWTK